MLTSLTTGNAWRYDYVLVSIVAADDLVLKHQVISINISDSMRIMPQKLNNKLISIFQD